MCGNQKHKPMEKPLVLQFGQQIEIGGHVFLVKAKAPGGELILRPNDPQIDYKIEGAVPPVEDQNAE